MIIIYIDIVLLVILLCLTVFTCGYCFFRVYRLQQRGQVTVLLKPRRVVFAHKREQDGNEELRTVVAYQDPFTGDYCVRKSRSGPKEYVNSAQPPEPLESPDSGLSEEYEPLIVHPAPPAPPAPPPYQQIEGTNIRCGTAEAKETIKVPINMTADEYSINKTWNWNYTEYQI